MKDENLLCKISWLFLSFTFSLLFVCIIFVFLFLLSFDSQPFLFHVRLFHRIESWLHSFASLRVPACPTLPWTPCDPSLLVAQSYSALWDPMDCNPPGSSVHGILQARILEWIAIQFYRESSRLRDQTRSPALQADSLPSELPEKPHGPLVLTYYLIGQTLLSFSFCSKMGLLSFIVNTCWIFGDSSFLWCFIYIPFFLCYPCYPLHKC